jgi:DNA-binding transcriptional LysR family regulator
MNIETLRIFCDVVQHQSFSRGAAANDVSQSAATQSVHRIEQYFGVQLVDRSKRPFVITPEGQACYEGFREVLELYDAVESRVRSLRREITGLVRVASIYSVGLHDMSRCMQDFMRRYPLAKVRLEFLRPNKVFDAVLNSEVDLGIISYPAASPEISVVPLRSERMVLVCHPEHHLADRKAVTAEHLRDEDFIAFDRDLSIRKEIDRYLRQRSVSIRVVMEFDNIETIKQAVEIGAGISILPEPTVRNERQRGTLAVVRLIAPQLQRPLGIIHRQRKVFTPTATKFVELLQEVQKPAEALGDGKPVAELGDR